MRPARCRATRMAQGATGPHNRVPEILTTGTDPHRDRRYPRGTGHSNDSPMTTRNTPTDETQLPQRRRGKLMSRRPIATLSARYPSPTAEFIPSTSVCAGAPAREATVDETEFDAASRFVTNAARSSGVANAVRSIIGDCGMCCGPICPRNGRQRALTRITRRAPVGHAVGRWIRTDRYAGLQRVPGCAIVAKEQGAEGAGDGCDHDVVDRDAQVSGRLLHFAQQ